MFSRLDAFGIEERLAYGLPAEKRPARSYFRYALNGLALSDARVFWRWMSAHALTDKHTALEYSNYLLSRKQFEEAQAAWSSQFTGPPGYGKSEFVYNGDFGAEPVTGTAFDWNLQTAEHVEIEREQAGPGRWSLRLTFDGSENIAFGGLSQRTVLPPGRYRFQAQVRTDGITTDHGVFFRICDTESPNRAETERSLGSTPWHTVDAAFAVTGRTRLVEIRLVRQRSLRFDTRISGSVRVDRVSLTRAE